MNTISMEESLSDRQKAALITYHFMRDNKIEDLEITGD